MNISKLSKILPEDKTSLSFQLRQIIFHAVKEVLGEEVGEKVKFSDVQIEHPENKNYGDYSTNIAMILAGRLKIEAKELANKLAEKVNSYIKKDQSITYKTDSKLTQDITIHPKDILESVSVAGQGFVNMTLSTNYLINQMARLLEKKETDKISQIGKGRRIIVEYTDPNPFKEFHIGHLYSNVIGESLAKIFEASGATVWRADFYGDVGMHVAKSVYGLLLKLRTQNLELRTLQGDDYINELRRYIEELGKLPTNQRQKLLGEGYALGTIRHDEDKTVTEEIKDINYYIYVAAQEILKKTKGFKPIINYKQYIEGKEDRLAEIQLVYEAGLRWSLEYFETIYKRLGTKFDSYYPESWTGELGMKLVEEGLAKGVLEKSEKAVIYKGEQDGLHTRVFVNKLGLPTYEAKDLGLAQAKYQDFKYDLSINVFGKEIDEYYQVVLAALTKIRPELGKRSMYIAHGMVNLPEGKMSSRTGNVITAEWLLYQTKKQALKIMTDTDLPAKEKERVAEMVAQGAIKYAFLKNSIGSNIVFDLKSSVALEGDSGPYLMYTYARCRSVLRKTKETSNGWQATTCHPSRLRNLDFNKEELSLLRLFYRFPEVVTEAVRTFSPNLICSFLFELAQAYNLFYHKHSILQLRTKDQELRTKDKKSESLKVTPGVARRDSPGVEESRQTQQSANVTMEQLTNEIVNFRLSLTSATAKIIKKGLYLLGIETVERM